MLLWQADSEVAMELTGTFNSFPLRELLELMQQSSMCGELEVIGQHGRGVILTRDGLVRHAEYSDKVGPEAVWLLFEESNAQFAVRDLRELSQETMVSDATSLCDEAEDRARSWSELRNFIPSDNAIPYIRNGAMPSQPLDSMAVAVARTINGEQSIRSIAERLIIEPIDVSRAIVRLIKAGVVAIVGVDPAKSLAAKVVVPASAPIPSPNLTPTLTPAKPAELVNAPLPAQPATQASSDISRPNQGGLLGRLAQGPARR
ncbi:DUF4388 domain-containing protein [Herpetosiphon llansteffanensis]